MFIGKINAKRSHYGSFFARLAKVKMALLEISKSHLFLYMTVNRSFTSKSAITNQLKSNDYSPVTLLSSCHSRYRYPFEPDACFRFLLIGNNAYLFLYLFHPKNLPSCLSIILRILLFVSDCKMMGIIKIQHLM